jgi:hypothetical protein
MLAQVLIAEVDFFVAMWKDLKLPDGATLPCAVCRIEQSNRGEAL